MSGEVLRPAAPRRSTYNMDPELLACRASQLPGIVGVPIEELFPDAQPPVSTDSTAAVRKLARKLTEQAFAQVDLSKIQPGDSVNILTSHHGFSIYGGEAYAEMVRTIRDIVSARCHTENISLKAGVGLRFRETEEYIQRFHLDEYFHGRAAGTAPVDPGVPIETELGTLYGIAAAYNAKWIIHVHNNDVRELHYHRQLGRLFKPFAMSYATIETRSSFHQSMGPRSANLIARAIFESDFVQQKFVCSCMLQVGPAGIMGIDADNDLRSQDKRFAANNLNWYGKILTLLSRIEDAVLIIDYPGPIPYTTTGGILFGNFLNANCDEFDLDVDYPPFTRYTDMLYPGDQPVCGREKVRPPNPAIRSLIINYCSKGYPGTFFAQQLPTMVVGPQADVFRGCEQNKLFMDYALEVPSLQKAVAFAQKTTGSRNILIFDGAAGGLNMSAELRETLLRLAPQVSKEVDTVLMPKWLRQRGIDPAGVLPAHQ